MNDIASKNPQDYGKEIVKATTIMFLALAITISGCSDAAEDNQAMQAAAENNQARSDMIQAKDAYTKCLQENSAETQKCAGFKEAYEVNLQAYRATSGEGGGASVIFNGPTVNSNQPSKPQQLEEQRQQIQQLKEQQETE
ncbi:hypothetical protein [Candidatus Binatus sp.]|uniref:hypothetical protein n=1 Tax=Candidatus Binatus sp. TaxID=2811406 RepID=UPI003CA040C8